MQHMQLFRKDKSLGFGSKIVNSSWKNCLYVLPPLTSSVLSSCLLLNGHSISQVRTHKHLGITFTSNLSWTEHIDSFISKSSTMIALLRHLRSNYHFSAAGLVPVYVSFVRLVLEYCSLAWCGFSSFSSSHRLESIQLKALAIAGCSPSRLQPLSTLRPAHLVRFFCRLLSDDVPSHLLNYCTWSSIGSMSSRSLRTSQCIRLPRPRTQNAPVFSPVPSSISV